LHCGASVLQCVAVCCKCVAVCCKCVAVYCKCVAVSCSVLQVCGSVSQCGAVCCKCVAMCSCSVLQSVQCATINTTVPTPLPQPVRASLQKSTSLMRIYTVHLHGSFVEARGSFTKIHGSFAKHTHHRATHRDVLQKYEFVQYVGLFCEKYRALLRYGFHLCKCTRKGTSRSKDDFHHANVAIHSYA